MVPHRAISDSRAVFAMFDLQLEGIDDTRVAASLPARERVVARPTKSFERWETPSMISRASLLRTRRGTAFREMTKSLRLFDPLDPEAVHNVERVARG